MSQRKPTVTTAAPSLKDLAAAVEAERQARADACLRDVEAALKRHGCVVLPQVTITGTQIHATWGIKPLDNQG